MAQRRRRRQGVVKIEPRGERGLAALKHKDAFERSGGALPAARAVAVMCLPGWSDWQRAGDHGMFNGLDAGRGRSRGAGCWAKDGSSSGLRKVYGTLRARFGAGHGLSGGGQLLCWACRCCSKRRRRRRRRAEIERDEEEGRRVGVGYETTSWRCGRGQAPRNAHAPPRRLQEHVWGGAVHQLEPRGG